MPVVYVALTVATFRDIDLHSHSDSSDTLTGFVPPLLLLYTFVLILICYLTGEKPRWRWGKD